MKIKVFFTGLACFFAAAAALLAADAPVTSITTNAGKIYEDVRIFQVDPDGVMFSHRHGGAKVLFGELPADIRTRLGYSADKEAAYKKEHAEKIREERKQALEYQKEQLKAEAAASAVQLQRLQFIQQQAYAGDYYSYGGYNGLVTPAFWDAGSSPFGYGLGYGGGLGDYCPPGYRSGVRHGRTSFPAGYHGNGGVLNVRTVGHGHRQAVKGVPYGIPALGGLAPSLAPRNAGGGVPRGVSVSSGRR